jgi:hypothetical protein
MQGFDLFPQQVPACKRGMLHTDLCGVITLAMMALGKDSDAVDMRLFNGSRELPCVEFAADVRDERRGMEIKVDLASMPREKVI